MHGCSSKGEVSAFSHGQVALLAVSALFLSIGLFAQQISILQSGASSTLQITQLEWISKIHFKLDHPDFPLEPPLSASKSFSKPSSFDRKPWVVDQLKISRAARQPVRHLSQPRPIPAKTMQMTQAQVDSPPVKDLETDMTERRKLQSMQRFLAIRLVIAMNAPGVLFAEQPAIHPIAGSQNRVTVQATVSGPRKVADRSQPVLPLSPPRPIPQVVKRQLVAPKPIQLAILHPQAKPAEKSLAREVDGDANKGSNQKIQPSRKLASLERPVLATPPSEEVAQKVSSAREWHEIVSSQFREMLPVQTLADVEKSPEDLESLHPALAQLEFGFLGTHMNSIHESPESEVQGQVDIASLAEKLGVAIHPKPAPILLATAANPNAAIAPAPLQIPAPAPVATHTEVPVDTQMDIQLNTQAKAIQNTPVNPAPAIPDQVEQTVQPVPQYVEAFDSRNTAVFDLESEMISSESTDRMDLRKGWVLAHDDPKRLLRTNDFIHEPTLSYISESAPASASIPVLHRNAINLFARKGNIQPLPSAGKVIGKLPKGWDVSLSDTAEGPFFLGDTEDTSENAPDFRLFAFFNVAPGPLNVYMHTGIGGLRIGISIPVMSGTTTLLDLSVITHRILSGHVVSATRRISGDLSPYEPLPGVSLLLVGQPNVGGITDENGAFRFTNVRVVGNYPFFIDSDLGNGKTHRYRVSPDQMENLIFYRHPNRQIEGWESQLEGGFSPGTGLVVTELKNFLESNDHQSWIPSVKAIPSSVTPIPETYLIRKNDRTQHTELPRWQILPVGMNVLGLDGVYSFLGVEVPDGLFISQVEDPETHIGFQILGVSSPNVISVMGPY